MLIKKIQDYGVMDWYFLLLLLFALFVNFPIPFTRYISYVLAIFWAFNYSKFEWKGLKSPILMSTVSLYLILAVGLLYSDEIFKGAYKLDKGSGLIFLPVVFFTMPRLSKERIDAILLFFVVGTVLAVLYCLGMSWYQLYTDGINSFYNGYYDQIVYVEWDKFGTQMPMFIVSNHVYMGLYIVFAMGCCMYLFFGLKDKRYRYLLLLAFPLLVYFLFLIKATMAFLALCSSSLLMIFLSEIDKKAKIMLFLGGIIVLAAGLSINKGMVRKVSELFNLSAYEVANSHPDNHLASRVGIYQCAFVAVKDNLPFGTGTGDAQTALNACYKERAYKAWLERGLNTHNQYLHYMLMFGFIGLLLFSFALFYPILRSVEQKHFLYLFFLLVFAQCSLTENLLTVNKGVMLFGFFNGLFGSTVSSNKSS